MVLHCLHENVVSWDGTGRRPFETRVRTVFTEGDGWVDETS